MNVIVFDTETTSIDKPFCYNVGYVIGNTEGEVYLKRDFVVEQIWHNLALFTSAYYADKRTIYVDAMRAKKAVMDKWGYIMRTMARDMKNFNVEIAYAYNSPFDDKVFTYNNDWFKTINPLDDIPLYDVRAYFIEGFVNEVYKRWCDEHGFYTDSGNYSTTAENAFRYLSGNIEFDEAHTALADSEIEYDILVRAAQKGVDITRELSCPKSIEKTDERTLTVYRDKEIVFTGNYNKITISKDKQTIKLK